MSKFLTSILLYIFLGVSPDWTPHESIYLQTDRAIYTVGDMLFYKAYLVDDHMQLNTGGSKVLYVDLIAGDSTIIDEHIVKLKDGQGHGAFELKLDLPSGIYMIRAYTKYIVSHNTEHVFEKTIHIYNSLHLNRMITRPEDYQVGFYPEGGKMVSGLKSRLGIRAVNSQGKGINVAGIIFDDASDIEIPFETDSFGFDMVEITPGPGSHFIATIEQGGTQKKIHLPEVSELGLIMRTLEYQLERVQLLVKSNTGSFENIRFECRSRNQVQLTRDLNWPTDTLVNLGLDQLPPGLLEFSISTGPENVLAHLQLFNFFGLDNYNIEFIDEKSEYSPNEKISQLIDIYDDEGQTILPHISVTVVEHRYTEPQTSSNIRTQLLLESQIKGVISEPGRYFLDDDLKFTRMQELLLTQGSSKMEFRSMQPDKMDSQYRPEEGLELRGRVLKNGNVAEGIEAQGYISQFNQQFEVIPFSTDASGIFEVAGLQIDGVVQMIAQASPIKNRKVSKRDKADRVNFKGSDNLTIEIFDRARPPVSPYFTDRINSVLMPGSFDFFNDNIDQIKRAQDKWEGMSVDLPEIEVNASRVDQSVEYYAQSMLYDRPDQRIKVNDQTSNQYLTVFDILRANVTNAQFRELNSSDPKVILRGETSLNEITRQNDYAAFYLNGARVAPTSILTINPSSVSFIDVIKSAAQLVKYGSEGSGGVINIYLKPPGIYHKTSQVQKPGITNFEFKGYTEPNNFYKSEDALNESQVHQVTLHWDPYLLVRDGQAKIEFYTSDRLGIYDILIEGISEDGLPLIARSQFLVK